MIIGLTGSIAAGKETLTRFLRKKGFKYFITSDLLKEKLEKRGVEITRESMQDLGDELREKHGAEVLMKMLLNKIEVNEVEPVVAKGKSKPIKVYEVLDLK